MNRQHVYLNGYLKKYEQASKAFASLLREQIDEVLGEKVYIEFNFVDNIPLEKSGKKRYFVSEIN